MKSWLLLALVGVADSALVVVVDGIPADQLTKRVVQHAVPGHALGAGLKAQGVLKRTVLSDLLGHSYLLPPARS